ncbi:ABC transporter substrate-binding protein [Thermodesulfobacteriota bacterium]
MNSKGLGSIILFFVISIFVNPALADIGVTDTEIKVGSHGALTGRAAVVGQPMMEAIQIVFDEINDRGGIHGRKLKLIAEDDNFMPSRAKEMVKKLIHKDKVFCIQSPLGTAGVTASLPDIESAKVPVLFFQGAGDRLQMPARRYVFGYTTPFKYAMAIQVDWAVKKLGKKRLAHIHMYGPGGDDCVNGTANRLKFHGIEPIINEKVKSGKIEYSGLVARMKDKDVDCVVITTTAQHTIPMLKEIERQGWKPTIIIAAGASVPSLLNKMAGSAAEGAYLTMVTLPMTYDDPFMNRYRAVVQKYGKGKKTNLYQLYAYGATRLFETALIQTGRDLTREKLIDTLETWKDYDTGWIGKISYSPTDHIGQEGYVIGRMKGGKAEILEPRFYPEPMP